MKTQNLLNHLRDEYYEWDKQVTVLFRKAERIKNRIDRNFQRYHMPNSAIYIRLNREYQDVILQINCLTAAYQFRINAYVKLINKYDHEKYSRTIME